MRLGKVAMAAAALAAAGLITRQQVRDTERAHPPTGRFVTTARGVRMHYQRHGRGRHVVLLHGALSQLQDMTTPLLARLEQRYEVFAFDRPGHGHSESLREPATVEAQARALREALGLLRVERPVLVGHSAGAAVALAHAVAYPDHTGGLVFLSGAAFPMVPEGAWMLGGATLPVVGGLLAHTLYQPLLPLVAEQALGRMFAPQPVPAQVSRDLPMEMLRRPDAIAATADDQLVALPSLAAIMDRYAHCPVPAAIFAGDADRLVDPHDHAARLAAELPEAELFLLPGLGHMIHHFAGDEIVRAIDTLAEERRQGV